MTFARRKVTVISGGRRKVRTSRRRSPKHMNTGVDLPRWLRWAFGGRRARRRV